jgi:hypothetical protein
MLVLRCTTKLLKEIGCEPTDTAEVAQAKGLSVWFANLLRLDRRKCVLFTNEKTLFSLFVPDLKREQLRGLGDVFSEHLSERLAAEGFGRYKDKFLVDRNAIAIAKTNSRSVLGSMNDFALMIEYHIRGHGDLESIDLKQLNWQLNRIIAGPLGNRYAIEAFERELSRGSI